MQCFAVFSGDNVSEATVVKNRGQILHLTPVKLRGGVGEMSEFGLQSNLWYTFDGASLDRLGGESVVVKKAVHIGKT